VGSYNNFKAEVDPHMENLYKVHGSHYGILYTSMEMQQSDIGLQQGGDNIGMLQAQMESEE
jgi:hypothetical protein